MNYAIKLNENTLFGKWSSSTPDSFTRVTLSTPTIRFNSEENKLILKADTRFALKWDLFEKGFTLTFIGIGIKFYYTRSQSWTQLKKAL